MEQKNKINCTKVLLKDSNIPSMVKWKKGNKKSLDTRPKLFMAQN